MKIIVLFFLAILVATSHARCPSNPIRLFGDEALEEDCIPNPTHVPGRPTLTESGGLLEKQINCLSWRLAVETNNLRDWSTVPSNCIVYVGNYMQGKQYRKDCEVIANISIEYAEKFKPAGDGKDIWVFGMSETSLSNLPYYARADVLFGSIPYNSTKYNEWVAEGVAPAVPAGLRLYKKLITLGYKVVILSGTYEYQREAVSSNLKNVGYTTWEYLILKGEDEIDETEVVYKSKKRTELVEKGYRIIGNIGDQWSDLTGENVGSRTFKMPNPMYYDG